MSNILLLCDSNLCRRTQMLEQHDLQVVRCTSRGAFLAAINESKGKSLLLAGLETIVNEALGARVDPMAAITTSINLLMNDLRGKVERSYRLLISVPL